MEVVIKIDEEVYKDAMNGISTGLCKYSNKAIRNGTPLPKGHGDLIDRSKILSNGKCCCRIEFCSGSCETCSDNCVEVMDIESAPTVIPADKESDSETESVELNEAQKKAIMSWFREIVENGEEAICENGHQFHAGKYDFCPICFKPLRTMTLEDLGE